MDRLPPGHFLGSTLKTHEVSGFRLTEAVYTPGMNLPHHSHELAKFCFVLSGSYTETLGRQKRARKQSALVYQPPDMTHAEAHDEPGHHLLLEIEPWRLRHTRQYAPRLDSVAELSDGVPLSLAARLYHEFRKPDEFSALTIEGLALELLAETFRDSLRHAERRPPRWLHQVTEMLRAHFAENLSLTELAATVQIHPAHLARTFRRFQRCTVGEFVRRLRIDYARRRLAESNDPLAEIALAAGFADQTHFSRSFKRLVGMTPARFRALFRKSYF